MARTKVLRVITRLNIGGPAIQAIELTARLDPGRFRSLLVAGRESAHEGSLLALADRRGVKPVIIPGLGREIRPLDDAGALWSLYRLMRSERPEIVHTHTAKAGALGRLAARLAGVPVVLHTFHGHVFRAYFGRAKSRAFILTERGLARLTDRVVTVSPRLKEEIAAYGIAPPTKIEVVPLGLDLRPFLEGRGGAFRRELGLDDAAKLVGIVGRLTPVKNQALFLRAAARIAASSPGARFVVVGGGELRRELERIAASLGLAGRVVFSGWRSDLASIYSALDVVVLTSLNEGTPVTLIEAMAAGRPVVATDVGGVADLVTSGENGFLVEGFEADAVAAPVRTLLDNPELARRMGEAGRARVESAYSLDRLLERIAALYDDALRKKGISG